MWWLHCYQSRDAHGSGSVSRPAPLIILLHVCRWPTDLVWHSFTTATMHVLAMASTSAPLLTTAPWWPPHWPRHCPVATSTHTHSYLTHSLNNTDNIRYGIVEFNVPLTILAANRKSYMVYRTAPSFNDLERPQTQISRSEYSLMLDISEMAKDTVIVTMEGE